MSIPIRLLFLFEFWCKLTLEQQEILLNAALTLEEKLKAPVIFQ